MQRHRSCDGCDGAWVRRDDGAAMANIVQFENVGLRYGDGPETLSDISFSLAAGSFYFLTGASGAGKTSLLRLLYLAQRPTRGVINLFGSGYAMRIWLDPVKLKYYDMTPDQVVAAIRAQNAQISAGAFGAQPAPEDAPMRPPDYPALAAIRLGFGLSPRMAPPADLAGMLAGVADAARPDGWTRAEATAAIARLLR